PCAEDTTSACPVECFLLEQALAWSAAAVCADIFFWLNMFTAGGGKITLFCFSVSLSMCRMVFISRLLELMIVALKLHIVAKIRNNSEEQRDEGVFFS
ncbi:hypothetical protein, partial [Bacteroides rodentium]